MKSYSESDSNFSPVTRRTALWQAALSTLGLAAGAASAKEGMVVHAENAGSSPPLAPYVPENDYPYFDSAS